MRELRGPARALLAAVLLMIGGILNVIYGIAAIDKSSFFQQDRHYVFGDLKTWGWVTLVIGVLEILASLSLIRGGSFGRYFAIVIGSLAAISALLDIPAYPFWSLAIFGLSLWIIYGLTRPGDDAWIEPSQSDNSMPREAPRPPM